ncbi:MAG: hypothetical protein LBT51_00770 [Fusobacteriaceae bacterium]|jgi:predicted DNA-binding protein YlxM (UPF0122 family)|nr:hypothetical protein [Fusobacteriaceae bacterium]
MELEKFLEISNLLEYYKNLLSDKQKEYLIDHFEEDFSLSEIAKNNGVSRQAVHDNIKRGVAILYEYENKLGFYKKEREIYDELIKLKKDFKIEKLDKIIDKMF